MVRSRIVISTLAAALASVAIVTVHTGEKTKSLYDRLGGQKGLLAIVNDFVTTCTNDPRIRSFFIATAKNPKTLSTFKANLFMQICAVSGGPCKYSGKDMTTAHAGMGISNSQFDAFVENLVKSLRKLQVAAADQLELASLLGQWRAEIVKTKLRTPSHEGPRGSKSTAVDQRSKLRPAATAR